MSPANISGAITSKDSIIARAVRNACPARASQWRRAYFLMISATPCTARKSEAERDHDLDRPAQQAAGIGRVLPDLDGVHHHRDRQPGDDDRHRHQKQDAAEHVEPSLLLRRHLAEEHVDADVLLMLERVARREQEHRAEHVPLDFQPGVRAVVDGVAHQRVERADDA